MDRLSLGTYNITNLGSTDWTSYGKFYVLLLGGLPGSLDGIEVGLQMASLRFGW